MATALNEPETTGWLDVLGDLLWKCRVTLIWAILFGLVWEPWHWSGSSRTTPLERLSQPEKWGSRTPLEALLTLVLLTSAVWVPLLVLAIWTRWARKVLIAITPISDLFRLINHRPATFNDFMLMPVTALGLIDPTNEKPYGWVRVAQDKESHSFSISWPTTAFGTTAEALDGQAQKAYEHLHACRHDVSVVRNEKTGRGGWWVVTWHQLEAPDELEGVRHSHVGSEPGAPLGPMIMGRSQTGENAVLDLTEAAHIGIQGQTRSGKSATLYTLLGQLAGMDPTAWILWGIDPNEVLLSPWEDRPNARVVLGSKPQEALELLDDACTELGNRATLLRKRHLEAFTADHFGPDVPLLVLVLEEFPSLMRSANAADAGTKPADRIAPQIQARFGRLVSEGAKVGIRVIVIAQRMDASIVGGAERAQMGTRITLGVDNADAVRMLSPSATPEMIDAASLYTRGRCLFDQRGSRPVEVQIDFTPYETYWRTVSGN